MKRATPEAIQALKTRELGLDPNSIDLTSTEAVANAVRRAAGLFCPCAPATLVRGVVRPLRGLTPNLQDHQELVENVLEALVALGDLLEHHEINAQESLVKRTMLYAAPPSFVLRESGIALLLGAAPDGMAPLPDDLQGRVEHVGHIRRLPTETLSEPAADLLKLGLVQLSMDSWLRSPREEPASTFIARYDRLLDGASASGVVQDVELLDSDDPRELYRRRWHQLGKQSGRFVARRPQAYGAPVWCYLEVERGCPKRLIDLPTGPGRGCDEAWHLQCAIDASSSREHHVRVRSGPTNTLILEVFFPVPSWVRRRWDAFGEAITSRGCLFAYKFPAPELLEELEFLRMKLWTVTRHSGSIMAPERGP